MGPEGEMPGAVLGKMPGVVLGMLLGVLAEG